MPNTLANHVGIPVRYTFTCAQPPIEVHIAGTAGAHDPEVAGSTYTSTVVGVVPKTRLVVAAFDPAL